MVVGAIVDSEQLKIVKSCHIDPTLGLMRFKKTVRRIME